MWENIVIFAKVIVVSLAYIAFAVYLVLEMKYLSKKHKH
jgi:hypothetical protein